MEDDDVDASGLFGGSDEESQNDKVPAVMPSQIKLNSIENKNSNQFKKQESNLNDLFGSDDENDLPRYQKSEAKAELKLKSNSSSKLCLPFVTKIPSNVSTMLLKADKFLRIETDQFHAKNFDGALEAKKYGNATAVVRWRYKVDNFGVPVNDSNGEPVIESNARLVKWTDGTYQLIVGNDTFEVKLANASQR